LACGFPECGDASRVAAQYERNPDGELNGEGPGGRVDAEPLLRELAGTRSEAINMSPWPRGEAGVVCDMEAVFPRLV
jgi:hypothetical protein